MNAVNPAIAGAQQALENHFDAIASRLANQCFTSAGLVIGTSSTAAVKVANTVTYNSAGALVTQTNGILGFTTPGTTPNAPGVGVLTSKTTFEIAFQAGTNSNVPTGMDQYFWVCLDGAGNGYLVPGTPAATGLALLPDPPSATTGTVLTGTVPQTTANIGTNLSGNVGYANSTLANGTVVTGGVSIRLATIIGYILVSNASGSAFTAGTTALSATGITVTYKNVVGPVSGVFCQNQ